MAKIEIDELLLKNSITLARIDENLQHVATKEDISEVMGNHVSSYHKISVIPNGKNGKKLYYSIGGLIAGAGAAIGFIIQHIVG